eukprot:2087182-Lingulodinium_polyedra.AAC.1
MTVFNVICKRNLRFFCVDTELLAAIVPLREITTHNADVLNSAWYIQMNNTYARKQKKILYFKLSHRQSPESTDCVRHTR